MEIGELNKICKWIYQVHITYFKGNDIELYPNILIYIKVSSAVS